MAKYEKTIIGQFEEVVNHLQNKISTNGLTMSMVDESNYAVGNTKIAVRVFDKYFMRNGSRTSLSLTVVGNGNKIFISAIGAGGGPGLLNLSSGAEDDMVQIVQETIEQMK